LRTLQKVEVSYNLVKMAIIHPGGLGDE